MHDEDENTPLVQQLRKQIEDLGKKNKEQGDALAAFLAKEKANSVASVLKAKGLPEKLASLYQGDASEEAVNKWVDEYADVFGVKAAPPAADASNSTTADEPENLAGRTILEAAAAVERAERLGLSADAVSGLKTKIESATSADELLSAITTFGR